MGTGSEAGVAGDGDGLGAVDGAEFEQDGGDGVLDGFGADAHPGGDGVVAESAGKPVEDLVLAWGEGREWLLVRSGLKPVCLRENRYVTSSGDAEAVLVTGVYGAGKSTVVADIGKLLTDRGERYGLLDVDWLGWFDAGRDAASHRRVVMSNITTVCEAYLAEGVRRLALAWSIRDRSQLDEVRQAVSAPCALCASMWTPN